jgi:phosphatidylglycerol---prolipoprotein diacylglyceryl transferase
VTFPVLIGVGSVRLHPHFVFELLAYATAAWVYLARRRALGDHLDASQRWTLVTAAVVGAIVGSRVLYWLEDPTWVLRHLAFTPEVLAGKTLAGAVLGGWLAVELEKSRLNIGEATGDLLAMPLAIGIAIGRVGCLLTGVADATYGSPTTLPWGVDAGDGVLRHPTPLYESLFMVIVACALPGIERRTTRGTAFRALMAAYLAFRLGSDALKPGVRFAGLTAIQWAAAAVLSYLAWWFFQARPHRITGAADANHVVGRTLSGPPIPK